MGKHNKRGDREDRHDVVGHDEEAPRAPVRRSQESSPQREGTVKFFGSKGFGFIAPSDGSKDVFIHQSTVERCGLAALKEGDRVLFRDRMATSGKGPEVHEICLAR